MTVHKLKIFAETLYNIEYLEYIENYSWGKNWNINENYTGESKWPLNKNTFSPISNQTCIFTSYQDTVREAWLWT